MMLVLGLGGEGQAGFHSSVLNSPTPHIMNFINKTWLDRYNAPISHNNLTLIWSSIVSVISVGGILGSVAAMYLVQKYGKKACLMWNNLVLVVASLVMGCSKLSGYYEMLLIGRFLFGLNEGMGANLNSQYVGEIAPKKFRGFTNISVSLFFAAGALLGQILGLSEILGTESLWPLLVSINGVTSLIQLVRVPFYPESPSYLLLEKGDMDACRKAAKMLWDEDDVEEEIDDLMKEKETQRNSKPLGIIELFRDRSSRWQLYLAIIMTFGLEFCGVNSIYFYSYGIFKDAGISPTAIPHIIIGIGLCDFLSVLLCSLVVNKFEEKTLLLVGYGLMALVMGLLTVSLSLKDIFPPSPYCSVVLVFLFVLAHGLGPGSVTVSISIAIFNQWTRPAALVVMGLMNWAFLFLIGMIFPFMLDTLSQYCFLIFIPFMIVFIIVFYKFLPETKGLSTLEITQEFNKLNFP